MIQYSLYRFIIRHIRWLPAAGIVLLLSPVSGISQVKSTIYVNRARSTSEPNGREGDPYPMVIDAIRAAKPGDEIRIANKYNPIQCEDTASINMPESSYYPEHLVINKPLTLRASDLPVLLGEYRQNPTPGKLIKPPFKPEDRAIIVKDSAELIRALKIAGVKIIYIKDNAKINMTGQKKIPIPSGVTLASGRGNGLLKGALLYWNATETAGGPIFHIKNSSVRITGIRFKGPTTGIGEDGDTKVQMGCFEIVNSNQTVEIDHNEFYGWPRYAIAVEEDSLDPSTLSKMHIHDNYIHHNLGYGHSDKSGYTFGYGVVVGTAYALIEKNVFDQNRHAIAGNGSCHSGYEARWNVVLDKNDCCRHGFGIASGSHSFDMHRRGGDNDEGWWPAGEYIMIRENTFLYGGREAFALRGRPTEAAFVLNNTFIQPPPAIQPTQAAVMENSERNCV